MKKENFTETMALSRLEAFEQMLSAILSRYEETGKKLEKLKTEGKEKTVTYRQLFAGKLQFQAMLSWYRTYGLLEQEK